MFDTIIESLEALWGALIDAVQAAWDYAQTGYAWIVGLIVVFVGLLDTLVQDVYSMLQSAVDALAAIVAPSGSVTVPPSQYLSMVNTFFPLDMAITIAVSLVALWAACTSYRLIKSWLPTVS
ncbi:MAG TPA: hypothetical protein VGM54_13445 [Chthoniobacter sp.]|jgi:hypothetical protein